MLMMLLEHAAYASEGGFTLTDFWNAAGTEARGVIITLVGLTIICTFVAIERFLAFTSAARQTRAVQRAVSGPLEAGDVKRSLGIVSDEAYKNSPLAQILRAGLVELDQNANEFGVENAHRSIERESALQIAKLKRFFAWLATTGSTAPFVGLFGTTFGVINSFQQMASSEGAGGITAIAGGISEALVTTVLGLVAAIPLLLLHAFASGASKRVAQILEEQAAGIVAEHAEGRS